MLYANNAYTTLADLKTAVFNGTSGNKTKMPIYITGGVFGSLFDAPYSNSALAIGWALRVNSTTVTLIVTTEDNYFLKFNVKSDGTTSGATCLNSDMPKFVTKTFTRSFTQGESGNITVDISSLGLPTYPNIMSMWVSTSSVGNSNGVVFSPVLCSNTTAYINFYAPSTVSSALTFTLNITYM